MLLVVACVIGAGLLALLVREYYRREATYRKLNHQLTETVTANMQAMQSVTAALDQIRQAIQQELPLLVRAVRDMLNDMPVFERRLQHLEEEYARFETSGHAARSEKRPGGGRDEG
jgi:ABC-type transporter Mla subunit MlaD